jgi:hypothetical protein
MPPRLRPRQTLRLAAGDSKRPAVVFVIIASSHHKQWGRRLTTLPSSIP